MAHTFNGAQKIIELDSLQPNVEVKELYSQWKEWAITGDNLKYEKAFRNFGGDPTTSGQTAPAYYFLTNGWKVRVDGFDATLSYNLYSDDGLTPVITINGGTAQINNSDVGIVSGTGSTTIDYSLLASEISTALGSNLQVTVDSAAIATATRQEMDDNSTALAALQTAMDAMEASGGMDQAMHDALVIINEGIKKSSLVIPHVEDLPEFQVDTGGGGNDPT